MAVVFTFARNTLFAPKTRQQVRLSATVFTASPDLCGWNHQWEDGTYRKWYCVSDDVWMAKSYDASNTWEFAAQCTTEGGASEGRGAYTPSGVLFLLYTSADSGGEVRERASWDDGRTWGAYSVAFTGGSHPTISVGQGGTIVRAAYIAASGKIQASLQEPGDTIPGASFFFKDDTGTDMLFEDNTFHVVEGYRHDAPWLLVCTIDGEAATSDWISSDECRTWTRLS